MVGIKWTFILSANTDKDACFISLTVKMESKSGRLNNETISRFDRIKSWKFSYFSIARFL